jgi:hypothetical protein
MFSFSFTEPDRAPNNPIERRPSVSALELGKAAVDGDLAGGHEAAVRRREKGTSAGLAMR